MGRLLASSSLRCIVALPRVGLLDGQDCRGKAVLALLGRERLVVAVVNGDVHTWLGRAVKETDRKWKPEAPHKSSSFVHSVGDDGQQTQPTLASQGPNCTQVLDDSSCFTCVARACDLCFARPLSPATLLKQQPKWHTAANKHSCRCLTQRSS